jgi:hypothetical protein
MREIIADAKHDSLQAQRDLETIKRQNQKLRGAAERQKRFFMKYVERFKHFGSIS